MIGEADAGEMLMRMLEAVKISIDLDSIYLFTSMFISSAARLRKRRAGVLNWSALHCMAVGVVEIILHIVPSVNVTDLLSGVFKLLGKPEPKMSTISPPASEK